jgi:L-amino acid N-acyltransferase YncA
MAVSLPRTRIRGALGRHGPAGVARILTERVRNAVSLHEEHAWWALDPAAVPDIPIPDGFELVRATAGDPWPAEATGRNPDVIAARLKEGHDLWVLRHGDRAAFSCWIYRGKAPALAARGGWLPLPDGAACIEDSVTDADYRGQGAAPASIVNICRSLTAEGYRQLLTKIELSNAASNRAAEKSGFHRVATMELTRVGPRYRVRVEGEGPTAHALAERLER